MKNNKKQNLFKYIKEMCKSCEKKNQNGSKDVFSTL